MSSNPSSEPSVGANYDQSGFTTSLAWSNPGAVGMGAGTATALVGYQDPPYFTKLLGGSNFTGLTEFVLPDSAVIEAINVYVFGYAERQAEGTINAEVVLSADGGATWLRDPDGFIEIPVSPTRQTGVAMATFSPLNNTLPDAYTIRDGTSVIAGVRDLGDKYQNIWYGISELLLEVVFTCVDIEFTNIVLDDGWQWKNYYQALTATPSGGRWYYVSGTFPVGLYLDEAIVDYAVEYSIAGMPRQVGTWTFTLGYQSPCFITAEKEFQVTIVDSLPQPSMDNKILGLNADCLMEEKNDNSFEKEMRKSVGKFMGV